MRRASRDSRAGPGGNYRRVSERCQHGRRTDGRAVKATSLGHRPYGAIAISSSKSAPIRKKGADVLQSSGESRGCWCGVRQDNDGSSCGGSLVSKLQPRRFGDGADMACGGEIVRKRREQIAWTIPARKRFSLERGCWRCGGSWRNGQGRFQGHSESSTRPKPG